MNIHWKLGFCMIFLCLWPSHTTLPCQTARLCSSLVVEFSFGSCPPFAIWNVFNLSHQPVKWAAEILKVNPTLSNKVLMWGLRWPWHWYFQRYCVIQRRAGLISRLTSCWLRNHLEMDWCSVLFPLQNLGSSWIPSVWKPWHLPVASPLCLAFCSEIWLSEIQMGHL